MKSNENLYPVIRKKRPVCTMIQHQYKEVEYLTFQQLSTLKGFKHLFSTRLGGVSKGDCATLNLSFTRGDDREAVVENFRRVGEILGIDNHQFVLSDQTHTDNIHVVKKEDGGNGLTKPLPYRDVDGFVTNIPGLALSTFYADCVPIYLVDPVKKVIGLCHSGWKGTVLEIGLKTIKKMQTEFGSDPKDIYAAIAPSICMDCYEVSEDVIEEIKKTYDEDACKKLFYKKENGKYQLDLWTACKLTLQKAGVLENHIEVTDICTCCNKDYLFSHRASKGKRGNLGAFLMISEI